jgi:hypothetical protein
MEGDGEGDAAGDLSILGGDTEGTRRLTEGTRKITRHHLYFATPSRTMRIIQRTNFIQGPPYPNQPVSRNPDRQCVSHHHFSNEGGDTGAQAVCECE